MSIDPLAHLAGLERSLDFHLQRHGVLSSNLAHADTPGYQPHDLQFSDTLQTVVPLATNAQHVRLEQAQGEVVEIAAGEVSPDSNGVQIEQAMAQVSANRLRYETGLELARRQVAMTRYAAADGSGS